MKTDFHPAAAQELEDSAKWYFARSPAAASRFAVSIEAALTKIAADPERFPKVAGEHQACSVEGFPFQIIFRHRAGIRIVAIAHAKRRPGYWKSRRS